jgi:hypothetical protein
MQVRRLTLKRDCIACDLPVGDAGHRLDLLEGRSKRFFFLLSSSFFGKLQHSTPIFVTLFSPTSVFRYLDGSSSLRLVTWDLAAGPFGAGISSPNEILCH